jgi:Zn-dependent membrane protease YugP
MTPSVLIISLIFLGISMLISGILKSRFSKYSRVGLQSGLSGREVAEKMLRDNGIYDVKVTSVNGFMTDHYNPANKTVNLSPEVFTGSSVAAAAVAAHECGHAIQHNTAYQWLTLRSKLVPAVQFSSNIVHWILLAGVLMINTFPQLLLGGIILFGLTTLFALVTLPVEFDASRRALAWLNNAGITGPAQHPMAKDALKWAAMTYVVAALASIAMLVQYVMIFAGSRRE